MDEIHNETDEMAELEAEMFIRCFYNTHECVHVYTQEVKGFKTVNRISPYLFLHFNISIVKVIVNFKLSPSSLKKKKHPNAKGYIRRCLLDGEEDPSD